jgi:hypothetical protein
VETGGWDISFQPYALVLLESTEGDWRVTNETKPTPPWAAGLA